MTEIKVWVGNLGKYNEGELVGDWFTLPHELSDIMKTIGVADGTEYEEYQINDSESPNFIEINHYSNLGKLNEIAEKMEELTEQHISVLEVAINEGLVCGKAENILDSMETIRREDDYTLMVGDMNIRSIVEDYCVETGIIEEDNPFYSHIDWESYAESNGIDANYHQINDDLWIHWIN